MRFLSRTTWTRGVFIFLATLPFAIYLYIAAPFRLRPHQSQRIQNYPAISRPPTETTTTSTIPSRLDTPEVPISSNNKDSETPGPWHFDHKRDSETHGLTKEQCDASFPGLFTEIDRAVAYRKTVGLVTPKDIDISWKADEAVRAMIVDQQLYIIETKFAADGYNPRSLAILHAIDRAIKTPRTPLPNIEFSFSSSDIANTTPYSHVIWTLTRTEDNVEQWLMSDFGYWSWLNDLVGSYDQIRKEIADSEVDFELKMKQVVWRGALKTNKHRKELLKVTKGKSWADVQAIRWVGEKLKSDGDAKKALSMPEHCRYQFVLQTEGRSYSGRGKYLQNCNSVVIIPKRNWIEPHHSLLISSGPEQNFLDVEENFSNLGTKVVELLQDPERAKRIAQKGVEVFRDRYLTPAAQACYWRHMIRGWAEVSFVPEMWEVNSENGKRRIRGTAFETFVIQAVKPQGCTWLAKIFLRC